MLGSSSIIRTLTNSSLLCLSSAIARERQSNRKTTSLTHVALDGNSALVSFDNVFHQRQAEAATLHIMDQPIPHPVKLLKNLSLFSVWNSDAVVCDLNRQIRSVRFRFD